MSVYQGQTVYPQILDSSSLQRTGLLSLVCVPGMIIHKCQKYDSVEFSKSRALYDSRYRIDDSLEDSDGSINFDMSDDFEDDDDPFLARNRIIQVAMDEFQDERIV